MAAALMAAASPRVGRKLQRCVTQPRKSHTILSAISYGLHSPAWWEGLHKGVTIRRESLGLTLEAHGQLMASNREELLSICPPSSHPVCQALCKALVCRGEVSRERTPSIQRVH